MLCVHKYRAAAANSQPLTLCHKGCLWSFCQKLGSSNTILLKSNRIDPNVILISGLQGFKVTRWGQGLHSLPSVRQGYYIQVCQCSRQLGGDCQLFLCHWTNWIQYKKPPPTLSNEISLHISQINWKILLLDSVKYLLLNTIWLLQLNLFSI